MSEFRFSIETTYGGENGQTTTVSQSYVLEDSSHDLEEITSILSSIDPIPPLDAFFWFDEVLSMEQRMLDRVLRESSSEGELKRDSKKLIKVKLRKYQENEEKDNSCSICSDKFKPGNEVAVLSCDHIFHQKCIQEWGHYKAECPLCKKSIPLEKENLNKNKDGVEESNKTMG